MDETLRSAGLGGDGDEIDAVQLVEKRLKLHLQYSDAPNWRTVGDLFEAIVQVRPELSGSRVAWRKMAVALCWYTGADPKLLGPDTLLIDDTTISDLLRSWFDRSNKAGQDNA